MRTFDPNRASIKQVLETDNIPVEIDPKEKEAEAAVEKKILTEGKTDDSNQLGLEIVSALKEITDKMLQQQEALSTLYREDNKKNIETFNSIVSNIEKTEPIIQTSPIPFSYVFEIERDFQGRIARVRANPVIKN